MRHEKASPDGLRTGAGDLLQDNDNGSNGRLITPSGGTGGRCIPLIPPRRLEVKGEGGNALGR